LHYVGREDPGDGHPGRAARPPPSRHGTSACPQPGHRPQISARSPHQHQP